MWPSQIFRSPKRGDSWRGGGRGGQGRELGDLFLRLRRPTGLRVVFDNVVVVDDGRFVVVVLLVDLTDAEHTLGLFQLQGRLILLGQGHLVAAGIAKHKIRERRNRLVRRVLVVFRAGRFLLVFQSDLELRGLGQRKFWIAFHQFLKRVHGGEVIPFLLIRQPDAELRLGRHRAIRAVFHHLFVHLDRALGGRKPPDTRSEEHT